MSVLCIFSICKNKLYNSYYDAYKMQEFHCKNNGYDCILLENKIENINDTYIERFYTIFSINNNLLNKYDYYFILDIDTILNINRLDFENKILKLKNNLNKNRNYNIKDKFMFSVFDINNFKKDYYSYIKFFLILFSKKYFDFFIKILKKEIKNNQTIYNLLNEAKKYYKCINNFPIYQGNDEILMAYLLLKYRITNLYNLLYNNIFNLTYTRLNINTGIILDVCTNKTFNTDNIKYFKKFYFLHVTSLDLYKYKEKYYDLFYNTKT